MWTGIAGCSGKRLGNWRGEGRWSVGRARESGPDRGLVFVRSQVM